MLEHALDYARRGWRVFPLRPGQKEPLSSHGHLDATTDLEQVRSWWLVHPDANIGIATGGVFGVVVDVDAEGAEEGLPCPLPETRTIRTARGRHLVYQTPAGHVGNASGVVPHVDIRGDGTGYIVAPPSVHPSGAVYAWEREGPAAPMPVELLELLRSRPRAEVDLAELRSLPAEVEEVDPDAAGELDAAEAELAETEEGGRGRTAFRLAADLGALCAQGRLGVDQVLEQLVNACGVNGLVDKDGEDRVRREIARGLARGAAGERERKRWRDRMVAAGRRGRIDTSPLRIGSDVEIAQRVLDAVEDGEELVYDLDALHRYDPRRGVWEEYDKHAFGRCVFELDGCWYVAGKKRSGEDKHLPIRMSDGRRRSALACAQTLRARLGFFAEAAPGLAFRNGRVLVTADGVELVEHTPDARLRACLPFDFDPAARPTVLDQVLEHGLEGDRKAVDLVYAFIGVCLVGRAQEIERALLLVGRGGDGKSTLLDAVSKLFPPAARAAIAPQLFGIDSKRAELAGKLINIVAEIPESEVTHAESWRAFISGDEVTARKQYGNEFTFRPTAGHLYSANRLPGTKDLTDAFWRRWLVMPFAQVPLEDRDPEVKKRAQLPEQLAGLATRALEGAVAYLRRGRLDVPERCSMAVEQWRKENDPVLSWLSETQRGWKQGDWRPFSEIHDAFNTWARQQDDIETMSAKALGGRLRDLGMRPAKGGPRERRMRGFYR